VQFLLTVIAQRVLQQRLPVVALSAVLDCKAFQT